MNGLEKVAWSGTHRDLTSGLLLLHAKLKLKKKKKLVLALFKIAVGRAHFLPSEPRFSEAASVPTWASSLAGTLRRRSRGMRNIFLSCLLAWETGKSPPGSEAF